MNFTISQIARATRLQTGFAVNDSDALKPGPRIYRAREKDGLVIRSVECFQLLASDRLFRAAGITGDWHLAIVATCHWANDLYVAIPQQPAGTLEKHL